MSFTILLTILREVLIFIKKTITKTVQKLKIKFNFCVESTELKKKKKLSFLFYKHLSQVVKRLGDRYIILLIL